MDARYDEIWRGVALDSRQTPLSDDRDRPGVLTFAVFLLIVAVCGLLAAVEFDLFPAGSGDPGHALSPATPPARSAVTSRARLPVGVRRLTDRAIIVVRGPEQAATVRRAVNEANVIRDAFGLSPILDDIVVVHSDTDFARLGDAIAEGNRIRATLGVEDRLVDLRSH